MSKIIKKNQVQNKYVNGSIIKALISLIIPITLGNLLQTAYNLTDTFWVGKLGKEAVAAVSVSFPIIFFVISLSAGFAVAGSILVSQYKGKRNQNMINKVAGQTLLMSFCFSLILSIIGYIFAPELIHLLKADSDVTMLAISYLRCSMAGLFFIFGYAAFQEIFRGVGNPKIPFQIVFVTVLLNLVLDPLFIFGYKIIPAMGVSGAAISTVATQGVAFLIALIFMKKGKHGVAIKWRNFKPDYKLIRRIFRLGLPTSLEQTSRSLEMILMTFIATGFGTVVLAAYGVGSRIFSFVIIPAISLAISSGVLVGQNVGAGKSHRAYNIGKLTQKVGFISLSCIGLLFFIFAKTIVAVFIPGEDEVIRIGTEFLRYIAFGFGLIGFQMASLGAFRGAGRTKLSMYITLIILTLQILLAWILSSYTCLFETGIWLAMFIAEIVSFIVVSVIYYRKRWIGLN